MSKLLVMDMFRWEVLQVFNFVTWPCSSPYGLQGPWPWPSWHRWSWRQASRCRPPRRSCRQPWWPPGAKERIVKLFTLRCKINLESNVVPQGGKVHSLHFTDLVVWLKNLVDKNSTIFVSWLTILPPLPISMGWSAAFSILDRNILNIWNKAEPWKSGEHGESKVPVIKVEFWCCGSSELFGLLTLCCSLLLVWKNNDLQTAWLKTLAKPEYEPWNSEISIDTFWSSGNHTPALQWLVN